MIGTPQNTSQNPNLSTEEQQLQSQQVFKLEESAENREMALVVEKMIEKETKEEGDPAVNEKKRVGILQVLYLPNVIFYAIAFFFAEMGSQVISRSLFEFLDYIGLSKGQSANVSTMNDVGAMIGTFAIGTVSQITYGKTSPSTVTAIALSSFIFYMLTAEFYSLNYGILMTCFLLQGMLYQAAIHMMSTTCSTDIGKGEVGENEKAVATVSGFMDGISQIGASVGQVTVGATYEAYGWRYGYLLLIAII